MLAEAFKKRRWEIGFKEGKQQEWKRVAAELEKAAKEGRSAREALEQLTPPDNKDAQ